MQIFFTILRILGVLCAVLLLVVFILPMTVRVVNVGNIAGTIFAVWLFCVSCQPVQRFFSGLMHRTGFTTVLYHAVNIGFVAFAVYGLVVTAMMVFACNTKPVDNATVVVLGAQVRPDKTPSVILRGRIRAAEAYLADHPDASAVLSGGQGYDEPEAEAVCMRRVMAEDGVDTDRLYIEDRSKNTAENFRFTREVMEANGLREDIAVTTDGFHMLRAMLIVRQQGIQGEVGAVCADTRLEFLPTYAVREWFALPYQLIRG
ncbi:MAG: YdcF family protein [Ruminococcus sp.]|nr:YdcF family protein [Ruminococcus sp.]